MPTIELIRDRLTPVFNAHHVKQAVLFGSYAKGSASETSDIDIFVDSGLRGLRFYGLLEDVVNAFDCPVDLIDSSQVKKGSKVMQEIERTGVKIYGE